MSFRRLVSLSRIALLAVAAATFAGCDTEPYPERPFVVGVITAASGPSAYIGQPERDVLQRLAQDLAAAGRLPGDVVLEYADSGGDPARAQAHFDAFAGREDVIAVIGPSLSGESIPLAAAAGQQEVPLLSLAASRLIVEPEPGRVHAWAFKFAQNDDLAATRLAGVMGEAGHRRVALLYEDSGFGTSGRSVFAPAAAAGGVEVAYEAAFPSALTAEAAAGHADAVPDGLDAVVVWGTAPSALVVQALRQQGFGGAVYLSHGNATHEFVAAAGAASEGVVVVGSRVLTPPAFLDAADPRDQVVAAYQAFWAAHFAGPPSHFGGHARDALEALAAVLDGGRALSGDVGQTRRRIRDGLEALRGFDGVTGTFSFSPTDHAGLGADAFEVYTIEGGAFVPYAARAAAWGRP